ncbi:MAG TPA: N-acetyltransferase [Acidimicrobiia bacterium]|nr:N-acetyltransferase [Acidimicrobiia bacterium]
MESSQPFLPPDYTVPNGLSGPGFRLEPLGPEHNERDHQAWMSSIDHIRATPGMEGGRWPTPMTLEQNLQDLEMHAGEFKRREAFAFSVLDDDEVIGCVYINPGCDQPNRAHVRSWVTATRADMDAAVWRAVSDWLSEDWPFDGYDYAPRH